MQTLNSIAAQENLSYVMGAELQRLPIHEADQAFAKLCDGKPQLVITGNTVCVLFANGEPFVTTTVHQLLAPPPIVEHHDDGSVTLS